MNIEDCTPRVVGVHVEWEEHRPVKEPIYSCETCDNTDCSHWKEYNE